MFNIFSRDVRKKNHTLMIVVLMLNPDNTMCCGYHLKFAFLKNDVPLKLISYKTMLQLLSVML